MSSPEVVNFLEDLAALCRRYKLVIAPSENDREFHRLQVWPLVEGSDQIDAITEAEDRTPRQRT